MQCQGGDEVESRAVQTELHILARHPEGDRVHRFTLASGAPWDPTDFGAGTSEILDPAELVFFADRVVRELPGPDEPVHPRAVIRRLRLAAAALREAAAITALGDVVFHTQAAGAYAAAHPDRFTAESLQGYAAALDEHATQWERGPHAAPPPPAIVDTLTGFRNGQLPEDSFLRAVLRYPRWFVPGDEQDRPVLWALDGRSFMAAQSAPRSPDGSQTHWMELDGRHLARHLPSDCAGLVFDLGTPAACVVDLAESADTLAHWVGVLDVEDALVSPRPGQAPIMLGHDWYLLRDADGGPLIEEEHPFLMVHVFTSTDRLRSFLERRPAYRGSSVDRIAGRSLFAELAGRSDYDAIGLHHGLDATELLGPRAAALFAEGVDGRSTARVLPARTIAEIHQFLDLEGASRENRTHQLEYLGEHLVARYDGLVAGSQRTWWFGTVDPTEDPQDLGAGPSRILCAGRLADLVRRRLRALPESPARVDADGRIEAAGAARWAHELEKMLVDGALPRSAVRTADGSRFLREIPQMATAAWIRDARRSADALAGRV